MATLIQKIWRGYIYRRKHIPNSILSIHQYLAQTNIKCSTDTDDGRINSCFDETTCLKLLKKQFGSRIRIPTKRHWYDLLVKDYRCGWLPCNIKSTTTLTSDNTGNLAMLVYAYTNYDMNVLQQYNNGIMSKILFNRIAKRRYNRTNRDYYFIVINKTDNTVITNSCKGLTKLTANNNNLPFQVCWSKNKIYKYNTINDIIQEFVKIIQTPKPSWRELFVTQMRTLNIDE